MKKAMSMKNHIYAVFMAVATIFCACDDYLDITPTGKVIAQTGEEFRALLTYVYKYIPEDRGLAGLRSDETDVTKSTMSSEDYGSYFDIWAWNDDAPQDGTMSFNWRRYYHTAYIANYIIEHRNDITNATTAEINQMVGEAYMLRAYTHFLLVNLYAEPYTACAPETTRGIPLQLEADIEAVLSCSSVAAVYKQILSDITEAEKHLNVEQWDEGYNYRFNSVSAHALRSRVALYMGNWQTALDEAEAVLATNGTLEDLNASGAKLPNHYQSVESIVAMEQVIGSALKGVGQPSKSLLSMYRQGDQRKNKYFKQVTASMSSLLKGGSNEYRCTFRTAEFYLTAAEAALELDDIPTAIRYTQQLMQKRYTAAKYEEYAALLNNMTKEELREEIHKERARELAYEGHRWFDLRRTTRPALEKSYSGTTYTLKVNDTRYTLRFPSEALEANPGLAIWNK